MRAQPARLAQVGRRPNLVPAETCYFRLLLSFGLVDRPAGSASKRGRRHDRAGTEAAAQL